MRVCFTLFIIKLLFKIKFYGMFVFERFTKYDESQVVHKNFGKENYDKNIKGANIKRLKFERKGVLFTFFFCVALFWISLILAPFKFSVFFAPPDFHLKYLNKDGVNSFIYFSNLFLEKEVERKCAEKTKTLTYNLTILTSSLHNIDELLYHDCMSTWRASSFFSSSLINSFLSILTIK